MITDKMSILQAALEAAREEELGLRREERELKAKLKAYEEQVEAVEARLQTLGRPSWGTPPGLIYIARLKVNAAQQAVNFERLPVAVVIRGHPCRISRVSPQRIYLVLHPGHHEVAVNRADGGVFHEGMSRIDLDATIAAWDAHMSIHEKGSQP